MPGTGSDASSGANGTTRLRFPAAPLLVFAAPAAGVAHETDNPLAFTVANLGFAREEAGRRVRQSVPAAAARFVLLTGGAFTGRARQFLERAPNPRLEKPFDPDGLPRGVAGLLRREGGAT